MPPSPPHPLSINLCLGTSRLQRGWTFFFLFLAQATLWGIVIFFLASHFATGQFWVTVLSILLLSLPIFVCCLYSATIHQRKRLWAYSRNGWYFRLRSGWLLKLLFSMILALVSSLFMLLQFHSYSSLQWAVFFAVIPLFPVIFVLIERFNATELHPLLVTTASLAWARWICPLCMVGIWLFFHHAFADPPVYDSCLQAIYAQKEKVSDMTGSALIFEFSQYLAWYNGVQAYALGRLGAHDTLWALLITAIGFFIVCYNSCLSLSCFLIPKNEYRRLLAPLSDSKTPLSVSPRQAACSTGLFSLVILFLYIPLMVHLETEVQKTPRITEVRKEIETDIIPRLEQIGEQFFKEGTIGQLQAARSTALDKVDISLDQLQEEIDQAFTRLTWGVDAYLDWYYSLVGEYARISKILAGDLEEYLLHRLQSSLLREDAFKEVERALHHVLQVNREAQQEYLLAARRILQQNQVDHLHTRITVTQNISLTDTLSPPVHADCLNLQERMFLGTMSGAGSGIVSGLAVRKISAKIIGKNTLQIAAKALSKIVLSKTSGAAGGAAAGGAAGAAIGSAVPVIGTAAGAAVGSVIGAVAAGITMDGMLLMLEEALSRETFKQEILSGIEEAQTEFKSRLFTN